MNVLEAVFKSVPNAMCIVYGAMTQHAPILGTLRSDNSGGKFHCYLDGKDSLNRTAETSNGFYKLYEPKKYGLDISEGFVLIKNNPAIEYTMIIDSDTIMNQKTATAQQKMRLMAANIEDQSGLIGGKTETGEPVNIITTRDIVSESRISSSLYTIHSENNLISNGLEYEDLKLNMLSRFNRFRTEFADNRLAKAFPRVFFTRPDLNLFDYNEGNSTGSRLAYTPPTLTGTLSSDPSFQQLYHTDPELLASLTKLYTRSHSFNPFLSNMASSFDLSDEKLETFEHGKTFTGWKIKVGKHTIGSHTAGSFSISYDETNRIEVYKIHKAWIDYISKVYRGATNSKKEYIKERRLDYACSVYYFLCAEDGETVLYWAKYVGVFPVSAPTGELSWSKGSIVQTPDSSVEYEYAWKEEMEPASLVDFNTNAGIDMSGVTSIINANLLERSTMYDVNKVGTGATFKNKPFVTVNMDEAKRYVVKLRYTKD